MVSIINAVAVGVLYFILSHYGLGLEAAVIALVSGLLTLTEMRRQRNENRIAELERAVANHNKTLDVVASIFEQAIGQER
jgi:hypothetical protein